MNNGRRERVTLKSAGTGPGMKAGKFENYIRNEYKIIGEIFEY